MGKRDALLKRNSVINTIPETDNSENIIDSIIGNIEEEKQAEDIASSIKKSSSETKETTHKSEAPIKPKKEGAKEKSTSELSESVAIKFNFDKKKEQRKTVHKNFLITEELNQKYVALAKKTGMNENQLFTSILEQIFNS